MRKESKSNLRRAKRVQQGQVLRTFCPPVFHSSQDSIPAAVGLHSNPPHKHNLNMKSLMEREILGYTQVVYLDEMTKLELIAFQFWFHSFNLNAPAVLCEV